MKLLPVGAELFRVDRQTDMTKLIVAFRNFANAHEIYLPVNFFTGRTPPTHGVRN